MKKGNLLLIIIILIIMAIVGVSISIIITNRNKRPQVVPPTIEENENAKLKNVMDREEYYAIENCVNKFYKYYASIYEDKNPKQENLEKTYNLLDEKYILFKNITIDNLATVLPEMKESVVATIYNMYASKQNEEIWVYLVEGILRKEVSKELSDFQLMVQIDSKTGTFSILLEDYIKEKHAEAGLSTKIQLEYANAIILNPNNQYVLEKIEDEEYALDLVERYKEEALYNPKLAYEHLDDEYKLKRFDRIQNFEKYVQEKEDLISNIKIEKYLISDEEKYTQYVCVDKNGYYYIIRENGIKKYTMILDPYTIDLPEFLEKYNKANTVEKVGYNIQKCLEAITNEDYLYVYDKLDFEFKAVNYPTLESFEKEMKTKLFRRNIVTEVSSLNEGSTYVYKLTIQNAEDSTKEQEITVIMQLKEGTDFVMSFSFVD